MEILLFAVRASGCLTIVVCSCVATNVDGFKSRSASNLNSGLFIIENLYESDFLLGHWFVHLFDIL